MKIVSKQIQKKLKKISEFRLANSIGMYYPMGSEVPTQDIMQEAISNGKEILLPKVIGGKKEILTLWNLKIVVYHQTNSM